jgi:cyclohexyl-isocyanide hydratase
MNSSTEKHINIGALVFPQMDQIDLTGPFEVLTRIPNSTFHLLWKELTPVRDIRGLIITPETTFANAPHLDLLVVPGGFGQEALMDDDVALKFIQAKAATATYVFSICTGALLCGAAGLLRGVKSTTHWSAFHLLPYFGAVPVNTRVVIDGKHVSAAGVTAGLDGALRVAALMSNERVAQQIQLAIEYAPNPPFHSGTPETAPPEILHAARASVQEITEARLMTAQRVATRLGIKVRAE